MNQKQIKLASVAAAIITAGGVATVISTWWGTVGWMTPVAHSEDIELSDQEHAEATRLLLEALQANTKAVENFERRWACDEISEEMVDLRTDMLDLDENSSEWIAHDERLTTLRQRSEDLSCSEFAD